MSFLWARGFGATGILCRNASTSTASSTTIGFRSLISSLTTGTGINRQNQKNPATASTQSFLSCSPTLLVANATRLASSSASGAGAAASHGDHTKIWTAEKIVSGALLPIIPLAFIFPSNVMDYMLAFTLVLHSHWGIEALVVDYVRPSVFGPLIPKIGVGAVWALSAITLGGLCYFTYTDVGLVTAIKMLWKL